MNRAKQLALATVLAIISLTTSSAFAQLTPPGNPGLTDYSGGGNISTFILNLIKWILLVTGSIAVLFIIIGGFQYILSGANEDLAKRGRSTIVNAVIGLIVILLSYTVVSVVYNTLTRQMP